MRLNGTTRVVSENGASIRKKALRPDVGHPSPTLLKTQINRTGLTYLEQNNHGPSLLNRRWSRRLAHTSLRTAKNEERQNAHKNGRQPQPRKTFTSP